MRIRKREIIGLFGSYFLKLFLRIVFENIKKNILILFKNSSCYMNLLFFMFFRTKKPTSQTCLVSSFFFFFS